MNLVLLFLSVYYIMQKIVKFLLEMSVFCQNLWYNVYSDISKGEVLTRLFVSIVPWLSLPPLIHGNSSSKTYLANRSFLFVPTKGTLLNGTPTKQYVFDSLRFTIVLSTQIGKWTLQNKIPVLRTLRAPSSRLFLTCRIFSFWNFHFPIFSYDLWNSSESLQSSRKLFFFCPTCRVFDFQNFIFWKKAYDSWKSMKAWYDAFSSLSNCFGYLEIVVILLLEID